MNNESKQETYKFPRGWFVIGASNEFPKGEVKPIKYFGLDLVAFRGEDEKLSILDAYCPHLGAHLAHGGKVVGNSIECPFHAWRFDRSGKCIEVPYAKHIPKKACIRSFEAIDRNGLSFVWHDPKGSAPDFEIPVLEEYGKAGWSDWSLHRREIKTHPREIVENVADVAHFKVVHHLKGVSHFENVYENHMATQVMRGNGSTRDVETRATYFGPAYQVTWMKSLVESRLVNAHTPIDENSLHLWFGVMIRDSEFSKDESVVLKKSLTKLGLPEGFELNKQTLGRFQDAIVEATRKGYHEDVAIWEHKTYRETPMLCDGDGPIPKLRRCYSQFYKDAPQANA